MPPLIKGLIIGFSVAAPVGPIGLLCIRRSITQGRAAGFVSGLGAASADAVCGAIAAAGLTAVTAFLVAHRLWLQIGGGIFLVHLGISMLRAQPATRAAEAKARGSLSGAYGSTFALTLSNPMTILSFIGIFAGAGLSAGHDAASAAWLVSGVFLGSAAWWLVLSAGASWLGARLKPGGLRAVNILAGAIVLAFGLWQLGTLALERK